jgi:PKD repeat protein
MGDNSSPAANTRLQQKERTITQDNPYLTVNDISGTEAVVQLKTTPIKVFKNPVAGFTIDKTTTCNGVAVTFTPNNINGQGTLITRTIEYGDGAKDTNFVVLKNHAFAVRGNYSPTVYLMDNFGCGDTLSKTISVVAPPKISFEPVSFLCKDTIVYYNNTTQGKNSPNYQWNWHHLFDVIRSTKIAKSQIDINNVLYK